MPTLRELADALGSDLALEGAVDSLESEVTGVHVSELADPTAYLYGGELLLTTGMSLNGHGGQARAYAERLARVGVAGLGIGLGPVHEVVPVSLVHACDAAGIPIFSVPAPTPFLVIARAYWDQLVSAGKAELNASLDAHRELIRAMRQSDPVAAIVRVLSNAVRGWAARLAPDGEPLDVWPTSRLGRAARLSAEIQWLRGAGPHTSAAFPLDDDDVVVQPLTRDSRLIGFVAAGAPSPMHLPDRQVVHAACALLALQLDQRHRAIARGRTERSCILLLALGGYLDAARALSDELGHDRLPRDARLVALAPSPSFSTHELIDRWERKSAPAGTLWLADHDDCLWIMAGASRVSEILADLRTMAGSTAPDVRAVASSVLPPSDLAGQRRALLAALSRRGPGEITEPEANSPEERAARQVEALLGYRNGDLVEAVAAFLRHRGHWERAAQMLGVHRNTLRQRIGKAEQVAVVTLDDPDQASHLWLALRHRGLAEG